VLTVVIPTLGRSPVLPEVLRRLREQRDPPESEVIVVVDADGDLPEEAPADRVLVARRPGASAARNEGIRAAAGDVVLFLGDDILASPRLLGEHALWHARFPAEHVAVLGLVERPGRGSAFERWLDHGMQSDYGAIEGDRAGWGQFYTTNVSVKKAFLERVGGFDEDLPFLYEDLDLGRRLHDEGLDLRYEPRARAVHDHPATIEAWQERMRAVGAAERAFVEKHPDVAPYFHDRLSRAAAGPPARGRGARLAGVIGPRFPLLGPRVWASAEAYFAQQLWPAFRDGWDRSTR
jgi:glycosyltransferase involved in cell wall biosynthesis